MLTNHDEHGFVAQLQCTVPACVVLIRVVEGLSGQEAEKNRLGVNLTSEPVLGVERLGGKASHSSGQWFHGNMQFLQTPYIRDCRFLHKLSIPITKEDVTRPR